MSLPPESSWERPEPVSNRYLNEAYVPILESTRLPLPVSGYLGSGSYGQAWVTEDPHWVLKITRDQREAGFFLALMRGPKELPGAWALRDQVARALAVVRVDENHWAVWKERAVPWTTVTGDDYYSEDYKPTYDYFSERLVDAGSSNCGWRVTDEGAQYPVAYDVWYVDPGLTWEMEGPAKWTQENLAYAAEVGVVYRPVVPW